MQGLVLLVSFFTTLWRVGKAFRGQPRIEQLMGNEVGGQYHIKQCKLPLFAGACSCAQIWGEDYKYSGDGGYSVCLDTLPSVQPINNTDSPRCVAYSYGINVFWGFDDAAQQFGCEVHGFEPISTFGANYQAPEKHGRTKTLHSVGLGPDGIYPPGTAQFRWPGIDYLAKTNQETWKLKQVSSMMKELNHSFIDILKIDVEGGEWFALPDIIELVKEGKVKQLIMELHFAPNKYKFDYGESTIAMLVKEPEDHLLMLQQLLYYHMHIFRIYWRPDCIELSMLHKPWAKTQEIGHALQVPLNVSSPLALNEAARQAFGNAHLKVRSMVDKNLAYFKVLHLAGGQTPGERKKVDALVDRFRTLNPGWEVKVASDLEMLLFLQKQLGADYALDNSSRKERVALWALLTVQKEGGLYIGHDRDFNQTMESLVHRAATMFLPLRLSGRFPHDLLFSVKDNPFLDLVVQLTLQSLLRSDANNGSNTLESTAGFASSWQHALTTALWGGSFRRYHHANPGRQVGEHMYQDLRLLLPQLQSYLETSSQDTMLSPSQPALGPIW